MNADDPRAKWTPIDAAALRAMSQGTATPGLLFPIGTNEVPLPIQQMPGIVSYFASSYQSVVPLANGMTAGAELAVVRTDGTLGKAYNFIVATSSDGQVHFNGPHKNFPQHHFASSSPVTVASLFGNVPITKDTQSEG